MPGAYKVENFSKARFTPENSAGLQFSSTDYGKLPLWDLSALYTSMESPEFHRDIAACQNRSETFKNRYAGKLEELLNSDPVALASAIEEYESIEETMGRVMSFAALIYTSNTSDPEFARFYGDAQEKVTNASSPLLFLPLEINRLDDAKLAEAMDECSPLNVYRPWLEDLRKDKPYQLEDRVEQLFHEKSLSGHNAWNRLFDETISSMKFQVNGEQLDIEPTLNLLQDIDRDTREAAAKEIGQVLQSQQRVFTLITNTLAKDKEISDRWRGFDDIADSRHLANRVEREVVDALTQSVTDAYPGLSHRYYQLKAGWLGLIKMQHWDRNAPLPQAQETTYQWNEAREIVLQAYGSFSDKMAKIASDFFANNWIDAPTRPGKSPGAFAHPTVPSAHPFVLLNYQGKPRDVMTLAHELGHGVHQILASKQGLLMSQTPLTLAETASVFGEMLTFRTLLENCKTTQERKRMLAQKVEDMLNTVVRQIAFYQFERRIHTARKEGELTNQQIGDIWIEVQKQSLGPVFEFDDTYRSYWSYIPHFIHSPFYVYAYAFGDCLVNSLYSVYQNTQSGFQHKYFAMLEAGGTKHHSEILAPFGLDASDPEFWQRGLSMISGLIDELEMIDND